MGNLGDILKMLFRNSSRIHIRTNPISNSRDVVELIDRFLDGKTKYELEWDDFISWKNENSQAEQVRLRLEKFEHLLKRETIEEYSKHLVDERNHLSLLLGMKPRALQK
jgi:hypothetical protein